MGVTRDEELVLVLEREREARERAETAERLLRTLVEASPLSIVTLDPDGSVTSWNCAAERIFGWRSEEVMGHPPPTVPSGEMEASEEIRLRNLRGEPTVGLERRRLRNDGSAVMVSLSSAALVDSEGGLVGSVVIGEDITDRIRAEEERARLFESERAARADAEEAREHFRFLAEAGSVLAGSLDYEATLRSVARMAVPRIGDWCSIHVVDEDGTVRQLAAEHVNPAKVQLANELAERIPYDPDAPVGVPEVIRSGEPEVIREIPDELLVELVPDPDLLQLIRELGLVSSMTVPMIARGRVLGVISLVSAESGRLFGDADLLIARELADRAALAIDNAGLYRQASQVAAERSAILRQIGDGIIMANPAGRIVFANDAARELYGTEHDHLLDAQMREGMRTPDGDSYGGDDLPLVCAARHGEMFSARDWRIRRPDGTEIIVEGSAIPIRDDTGRRLGAVMTVRDVTLQRTLERQKDEFLSAAAHDMKNPLATIKTMAQMLERRLRRMTVVESEPIVEGLRRIDTTASRMAGQINELLDITRIEMNRPLDLDRRRLDLIALVREIVGEQQQAPRRHRIRFEAGNETIVGRWDRVRLRRALDNLVSNAVKFSPNGGDIVLAARMEREGDREWATVSVTDSGIGVPESELAQIFERFYRASNVTERVPGTGIGLASVWQIVQDHGGSVSVESSPGMGTTFTIRLPMRTEETNS